MPVKKNVMKWFSTLKVSGSLTDAILEISKELQATLGTRQADLGLLFVSASHRQELIDQWAVLKKELPFKHLLGCTAGGVIGDGKEEEGQPAVSLTAALLPGVKITPFHLHHEHLPDGDSGPQAWKKLVGSDPQEAPHFLILADPFSFDASRLVEGLDFAFPNAKKVGGLASGGAAPNENLLFNNEKLFHKGAVGVALSGEFDIDVVVAQGCRPIGKPLKITAADKNILVGVDGIRPLEYLQRLYTELSPRDQQLLQQSLFMGISMDSFKTNPRQGDFLIRNIIGLDESQGILAVGAELREGQTVQFHLRDAVTSHDDLKQLLTRSRSAELKKAKMPAAPNVGAILFSCLGRGHRLYGEPDHDSLLFKSVVGDYPLGGFFCNGEIGPVGGKTFLHGYTSSIAVFKPRQKTEVKKEGVSHEKKR